MRRRLILISAVLALYGCSLSADYGEARKAGDSFHSLVDSGEYAAIYDGASKGFQQSLSRDQLIGFLSRVNRKMGKCEAAVITFGGYVTSTSGASVTMNSSRVCANGKLTELFVWRIVGGKATLLRYTANSPLLLTD
jgi:hypothetical protein